MKERGVRLIFKELSPTIVRAGKTEIWRAGIHERVEVLNPDSTGQQTAHSSKASMLLS